MLNFVWRSTVSEAVEGKESRTDQILKTATKIFSEKTYHGTTLQDIADAVGMLKGSLYYYITGKKKLLAEGKTEPRYHPRSRPPLAEAEAAVSAGKKIDVFAGETRPFLQGARLTAWELQHDGIPTTIITDNMAGHFLKSGRIGCVVVGADRIAANGDVANKVGTYSLAVLARENGVPFYVAAPVSTLDLSIPSGDRIPIEQRPPDEVTHVFGVPVAPEGVPVENPAFDVTPHRYVTAIITERGVARPPYTDSLKGSA